MNFKSYGLVFKKKNFPKWNKSHAWVPTPILLKKNICRVFYAGRDENNHSNIGSFDINLKDPKEVYNISKQPILKLGNLGYFDDAAVIPSQIIYFKKKYYLFYIGWKQGKSVPYSAAIGLASSNSLGKKFRKISKAPIIGTSEHNPIFTASCYCLKKKNKFELFYTSNTEWKFSKGVVSPKYLIKEAKSKDLINWNFKKKKVINLKKKEIAITRPWVIENSKYKNFLLYSYGVMRNKKNNYKIGLAIKKNNKWKRIDNKIKIENTIDKFDNKTQEYAATISNEGKIYMFYNGNNFGKNGIGLAVLKNIKKQ